MGIISDFLANPCIYWQTSFAFSFLIPSELHFEAKISQKLADYSFKPVWYPKPHPRIRRFEVLCHDNANTVLGHFVCAVGVE